MVFFGWCFLDGVYWMVFIGWCLLDGVPRSFTEEDVEVLNAARVFWSTLNAAIVCWSTKRCYKIRKSTIYVFNWQLVHTALQNIIYVFNWQLVHTALQNITVTIEYITSYYYRLSSVLSLSISVLPHSASVQYTIYVPIYTIYISIYIAYNLYIYT